MGSTSKKQKSDRDSVRVEKLMKAQQEERRSKLWIYGIGITLILVIIVSAGTAIVLKTTKADHLNALANKPINGVQTFTGLTRNHTLAKVKYAQNPPVGGDHNPNFINCGVYTHAVDVWEAVHSLEHGAVWITYQPNLSPQKIAMLTKQAAIHSYELLTPYPGLPSPIVASAWGKQLKMDNATDPRLRVFLQTYLEGPQTPEPGAACSGGIQG